MTPDGRGGLRRARPAWAGLVLGVALTVVPGVSWVAGAQPGPPLPAPAAPPPVALVAPAAPEPSEDRLAAPVQVRFPDGGVDAPVVPVGVDAGGRMEVPEDVRTVGWYRFGSAPGAVGSAVLAGHVDDAVQGRGAFYRLAELSAGDAVQVQLADGTVLEHRVTLVERVGKEELPVDRLFARSGPPRLTLVTCGGPFDRERRSYRDNVVVTAEPVP